MDSVPPIKYTDVYILLALAGLVCVLLLLMLLSPACWRFAQPTVWAMLSVLGKFAGCVLASIWANVADILTGLTQLPISWYIMAALTVPGACNLIAPPLAVVYFAGYCAAGLYICASIPGPKKATPLPLAAKTANVGAKAHFLSELRITRASQN
jgi:hypothetical protein